MLHSATTIAGPHRAHGCPSIPSRAYRPCRLAAAPRLRRRQLAPVAAFDPATTALLTGQAQEFFLTLIGMGAVACVAQASAMATRRAAAVFAAATSGNGSGSGEQREYQTDFHAPIAQELSSPERSGALLPHLQQVASVALAAGVVAAARAPAWMERIVVALTWVSATAVALPIAVKRATEAASTTAAAAEASPTSAPAPASRPVSATEIVAQELERAALMKEARAAAAMAAAAKPAELAVADIKAELQAAAADAVAAVKTAAEAPIEARRPAPVAASPPTSAPNGDAVKPGLTVEEATKQVQEWIAAWRSDNVDDKALDEVDTTTTPPPAPISRVTEPSLPASAAAVLSAMTSDAPVAATPVTSAALHDDSEEGDAAPEGPAKAEPEGEPVLVAATASVAAPLAPTDGGASEAAAEVAEREAAAAYKQRISEVKADSKLAGPKAQAKAEDKPKRRRLVEVGQGYEAKIMGLWDSYQKKKVQEEQLLAKSDQILQNLAKLEAEEKEQLQVVTQLSTRSPSPQRQQLVQQGFLAMLLARVLAIFEAVQRWVAGLVASLTGGSGRGGSAAGSSA